MQSHQSIQLPRRVDARRKALLKELQMSIARQPITTPKRIPSQQYNQMQNFETLKKKQHIDVNASWDKKQNEKPKIQNLRNQVFNSQNQTFIKPHLLPDSKSMNSAFRNTEHHPSHPQQELNNPNSHPFNQANLNIMLDHKISNFGLTTHLDLRFFSEKERLLISIQEKLDNYLIFLKQNRKKKKGEFLTAIKKTFLENNRIFLEFSHIKKILYIDENLYTVHQQSDKVQMDCLVDIKLSCRQTEQKSLQIELRERKINFRSKLFAFKSNYQDQLNGGQVQIPEVRFQFEQALQNNKNLLKSNLKQLFDGQLLNKKKIDKFFVLQNKNSTLYKQSKKILEKGIKKVQTIIKKENQIDLSLFSNKLFQKKLLSQKEIESIVEEINLLYRNKNVSNMHFSHLKEGLVKRVILAEHILEKVIQIFVDLSLLVNRQRPFLKAIEHKSGKIIQMDKSTVKQFISSVFAKEEWKRMFEFSVEMNNDYLKKKLQQERQKLFKQAQKQAEQEYQQEQNYQVKKLVKKQTTVYRDEQQYVVNVKNQMKELSGQQLKIEFVEEKVEKMVTPHKIDREEYLSPQKDDFRSTLSNSEHIYYEDEEESVMH